jgi:hypothetical protein
MQHDQGFTRSHWTPPSGDYSLRIAPAAAKATINTAIMNNIPTLMAILMVIAMRRYYTPRIARWICPGLSYKPLNTAIGRALAPIASSGQSNFGCFLVHPNR